MLYRYDEMRSNGSTRIFCIFIEFLEKENIYNKIKNLRGGYKVSRDENIIVGYFYLF